MPSKTIIFTLRFIAIVQAVLGVAFLFIPELSARSLGLTPAPGWANWLFGMMAARFLAFAYGMWMASNQLRGNPGASVSWIKAMIGVQAIDWCVTLFYLWRGDVTLFQVTTAAFLPIIFILILMRGLPGDIAASAKLKI